MRKTYDAWPVAIFSAVFFYLIGVIIPFYEYKAAEKDWDYFGKCFSIIGLLGTITLILGIIGFLIQKGFLVFDFERMVAKEACKEYKKWYQRTKKHSSVIIAVSKDLKKVSILLPDDELILKRSSGYLQKKAEINQWNQGTWSNIDSAFQNASQCLKKAYPMIKVARNTNQILRNKCDQYIRNNVSEWSKVERKYKLKAIKKIFFSEYSFWWLFNLGVLCVILWSASIKFANKGWLALVISLWNNSKSLLGIIFFYIIMLTFSACLQLPFLFGLIFGKGMQCVGRIDDAHFVNMPGKGSRSYYDLHIEVKKNGKKVIYEIKSTDAKYKYNSWKDKKNVIVVTVDERTFILLD